MNTVRVDWDAMPDIADAGASCLKNTGVASRVRRWLLTAVRRRRQRRALARLDGRLLRDIGVTPEQAAVEARKPFWRE